MAAQGFHVRLQDMVNSRQQRIQLLEVERELHIRKRSILRKQNSRLREIQQLSLGFNVRAEEMKYNIKAAEDRIEASNLLLKDLEFKQRALREELFELEKERAKNSKFYKAKEAEMRDFTRQVQDHELIAVTETAELRTQVEELKSELQRVTQLSSGSCELDAALDALESERKRLVSQRQVISSSISSNSGVILTLEERLHEALQRSLTKQRELVAVTNRRKKEILVLQAKHRATDDQVLQAMNSRDQTKRLLQELDIEVARKTKSFYSCQNSY